MGQPFVCQLFLLGCIALNLTAPFYLGQPSDFLCRARPCVLHTALTFAIRWDLPAPGGSVAEMCVKHSAVVIVVFHGRQQQITYHHPGPVRPCRSSVRVEPERSMSSFHRLGTNAYTRVGSLIVGVQAWFMHGLVYIQRHVLQILGCHDLSTDRGLTSSKNILYDLPVARGIAGRGALRRAGYLRFNGRKRQSMPIFLLHRVVLRAAARNAAQQGLPLHARMDSPLRDGMLM